MAEPAWFTAKLDQRRALLEERVDAALLGGVTTVFVFLTEPEADTDRAVERWENTCDGCGRYCPNELSVGQHIVQFKGVQLLIGFGLCPKCKEGFDA